MPRRALHADIVSDFVIRTSSFIRGFGFRHRFGIRVWKLDPCLRRTSGSGLVGTPPMDLHHPDLVLSREPCSSSTLIWIFPATPLVGATFFSRRAINRWPAIRSR